MCFVVGNVIKAKKTLKAVEKRTLSFFFKPDLKKKCYPFNKTSCISIVYAFSLASM